MSGFKAQSPIFLAAIFAVLVIEGVGRVSSAFNLLLGAPNVTLLADEGGDTPIRDGSKRA